MKDAAGNDNTRINSDSYVFVGNNNVGRGDDNTRIDKMKPLFDELADATLERVQATYSYKKQEGRGAQYGDTMRECAWLTVWAVDEALPDRHRITDNYRLAIFLAGMVDIKLERMRGGYRDDNLVDLIAYAAALAELMKQLTGEEQDDRDNTAGD